ncbi:MAG: hypothetical protein PWQ57_774 [Desulfovibrionales bacterium]|jgi:tRNA(Ile2) C34 agmatinyltransferase TiaS|nr:hypothetical protein [Desulfovibrionales bacterium]
MITIHKNDAPLNLHCRQCGKDLGASRTCLRVFLKCPACGAAYPLDDYGCEIDDDLEERLADIPLNRL